MSSPDTLISSKPAKLIKTKKIDKTLRAFKQYESLYDKVIKSPPPSPTTTKSQEAEEVCKLNELELPTDDPPPEKVINTEDIIIEADNLEINTDCPHANIFKDKEMNICSDCGKEMSENISHEQEWRCFNDSSGIDPTRCQFRKTIEKGIAKELEKLGLPPDVCILGNKLYMMATRGEVKKCELRKGISFVCAFEAFKMLQKHKTPEHLQAKFSLEKKSISQAFTYFKMRIPKEYYQNEEINAEHYIPDIMKTLNIQQKHIDCVIKLYDKIKDSCPVINRSNPQSISKALVYYYLMRVGCNITLVAYAKIVELSHISLFRLCEEINRVLGTTVVFL